MGDNHISRTTFPDALPTSPSLIPRVVPIKRQYRNMRTIVVATVAVTAFAQAVSAVVEAKNIIYVIPDGWGPTSQTLARDLHWLIETEPD